MATQNCPRCNSDRIRQGYRPTSIFRKLMFRYNLLCNDCNWEFVGFAVPGTVTTKVKRKQKPLVGEKHYSNEKIDVIERTPAAEKDDDQVSNFEDFTSNSEIKNVGNDFKSNQNKNKVKKRVRVKLT